MEEQIERDRKFYKLGLERKNAIIRAFISHIQMSGQKTFTAEQVIALLNSLLDEFKLY